MKGSLKFGLLVFVLLIIVIAVVDMTSKKPIIWDRTYEIDDKNPFGMFVTRQELPRMLDHQVSIEEITTHLYSYLDQNKQKDPTAEQFLFLNREFGFSDAANTFLLDRVRAGAHIFVAAEIFNHDLLDSLGVDFNYFYGDKEDEHISDFLKVELTQDQQAIAFSKSDLDYSFTKLPNNARILGGIRYKQYLLPNFVSVKFGKGTVFLHLKPELFANYYLLNNVRQYQYAARAFRYLNAGQIKWYTFDETKLNGNTPLKVILGHRGLRQAWYLLLISLILFLIYKSKREQRAVEIMLPEPNLSKQFCETIATLYYENGTPANMLHKKIDYFLHDIRSKFHVDTLMLRDEQFVDDLSARSAVDRPTSAALMALIAHYQDEKNYSDKDLRLLNSKIEEFKLKAKM